jgi:hypothetical protein
MRKAYGFAWAISGTKGWSLCQWAEPSKDRLERDGKPSPEAVMVRVELVPANTAGRKLLDRSK